MALRAEIPKEKYKNIFNGTYNRTDYFYKQKKSREKALKNYK